jgi:hypothetical protein
MTMTQPTGKAKGGMNSRWIAMRCKEAEFWQFLSEQFGAAVRSEYGAIEVVKTYGGVESRAEFDTDPHAARRFHDVLRRPFSDYVQRKAARQPTQYIPA